MFSAVQCSKAKFGVVPYENSSNGPVIETLDLLINRERAFPDIQVCSETYLDVQHCLLGHIEKSVASIDVGPGINSCKHAFSAGPNPATRVPRTKPILDLQHIKYVISHPQALGQCEKFLAYYLGAAEHYEVTSTSEAAKMVAEDLTGTKVAIASSLAAGINGLDILAKSIQDVEENTTRFATIHRGPVVFENLSPYPQKLQVSPAEESNLKALVSLDVNHSQHGALASALLVFKTYDLNVTNINTRPSRVRPWHYIFLLEFEGRRQFENEKSVERLMKDLDKSTEGSRWHGSWIDRFSQR